jgi:hypothetical protein
MVEDGIQHTFIQFCKQVYSSIIHLEKTRQKYPSMPRSPNNNYLPGGKAEAALMIFPGEIINTTTKI